MGRNTTTLRAGLCQSQKITELWVPVSQSCSGGPGTEKAISPVAWKFCFASFQSLSAVFVWLLSVGQKKFLISSETSYCDLSGERELCSRTGKQPEAQ